MTVPVVPRPAHVEPLPEGVHLAPGTPVLPGPGVPAALTARLATRLGALIGAGTPLPVHQGTAHPSDAPRPTGAPTDPAPAVHLAVDATTPGPTTAGPDPDESYTLTVDPTGVHLHAPDVAGLRHAVTTLLALAGHGAGAVPAPGAGADGAPGGVSLQGLHVADAPRYAWRGLHLDVARHFLPVAEVLAVLETAADLKLNRLVLHLTDDQGWRLDLPARPALAARGATTQVGGGPGGHYTPADVQRIVAAGRERGVVVVPEVDTPGHVHAAQVAHPELLPPGTPAPEPYTGIDVGFSRLHADLPATAPFVHDVLTGAGDLFDSPWVHIGGDEALELAPDEYSRLVRTALDTVTAAGRTPVAWQEAAAVPVPAGTVLQVWDERVDLTGVVEAARRGARVLLSPATRTYLDLKPDPGFALGLVWAGTVPATQVRDWDPDHHLPGLPADALVGVEACLWTETVRSLDDVWALLRPRLDVFAEVAWTPQHLRGVQGTPA